MNDMLKDSDGESFQQKISKDLQRNFMDALNLIVAKLTLDFCANRQIREDFNRSEFMDQIVLTWRKNVQTIIQSKINEFYAFQKKNKNKKVFEAVYGSIDIEDVQSLFNESYKHACQQIDEIVAVLKDE